MPGIPAKYLETFARLRRATDQLHHIIETGEFYTYGYLKRRKLIRRVRRLYGRLVGPVSPAVIGSAIAAVGILSLAGCFNPADTPPVDTRITPVFELKDAPSKGLGFSDPYHHGNGFLTLADLDGDSSLDLYYAEVYAGDGYDYYVTHQRGDGSGGFVVHSDAARDAYGLVMARTGDPRWQFFPLTFVDIDKDGDLDLIASGYYYTSANPTSELNGASLFLLENTGTKTVPSFATPEAFAYGAGVPPNRITAAQLIDIDGDGDLDLITTYFYGTVYLTLNTSQMLDSFTAAADSTVAFPFAYNDFPQQEITGLAVIDVDNDGDKDILVSGYVENDPTDNWIAVIENTSTGDQISFADPQFGEFGLVLPTIDRSNARTRISTSLAAGDIDGDGDVDVIVGTYITGTYGYDVGWHTQFFYFENTALP